MNIKLMILPMLLVSALLFEAKAQLQKKQKDDDNIKSHRYYYVLKETDVKYSSNDDMYETFEFCLLQTIREPLPFGPSNKISISELNGDVPQLREIYVKKANVICEWFSNGRSQVYYPNELEVAALQGKTALFSMIVEINSEGPSLEDIRNIFKTTISFLRSIEAKAQRPKGYIWSQLSNMVFPSVYADPLWSLVQAFLAKRGAQHIITEAAEASIRMGRSVTTNAIRIIGNNQHLFRMGRGVVTGSIPTSAGAARGVIAFEARSGSTTIVVRIQR